MIAVYTEKWWVTLLRGIFALLIGLAALLQPVKTAGALLVLFAVYMFIDGLTAGSAALAHHRSASQWGYAFFRGFLGILLGVFVLIRPDVTVMVLIYLVAFWALVTGILEIIGSFQLKDQIGHAWPVILTGIVSVLLAFILLFNPRAATLALIWIFGIFLIFIGFLNIYKSFRLQKYGSL